MPIPKDEREDQKTRLLAYLTGHKSITPMRAWRVLGIYRLAARIYDLRVDGHAIKENRVPVRNRFGEVARVSCYRLVSA